MAGGPRGDAVVMFGLNVSPSIDDDPISAAQRAEELGFSFVSMNDHLHGATPRHETWTLLAWIAATTSRIRVASRVLAVPYRHPAVLAKMAETLDRLSGGRLILGLGGGYSNEEFAAFGLGVPSPGEKVDGLEEAVRITRGLWSQKQFTFTGHRYHTEGARIEPKPERQIPIWLGTYGKRALELTGRLADGWIPTYELALPEAVAGMRDRIMDSAIRAGRNPADISCVYNVDVRVDRDPTPDFVVSAPPDQLAERLTSFADLGFDAVNLVPFGPEKAEQIERLGHEVIPAVIAKQNAG
jgi:probable F420-dependent oxidoreductase